MASTRTGGGGSVDRRERLWVGAAVGAPAGLAAGLLLVMAVSSVGDPTFPKAAAESRFWAEGLGWVVIVLTASLIAMGPKGIAAITGPAFLFLVALGRSVAQKGNQLRDFRTEAGPPGPGSVLLAVGIGAVAGMVFVARRAYDRQNELALLRKQARDIIARGGGR